MSIYSTIYKYRKIPLIPPGRVYGQRANLMGLYSGEGGDYIPEGLYSEGKTHQFLFC